MTTRRQVIKTMIGAAIAGYGPVGIGGSSNSKPASQQQAKSGSETKENSDRLPWRNWSGSQVCYPANRQAPATVAALQQLLADTTGTIRPVGSGHSFTSLVITDDHLISLDRLQGLTDHNSDLHQASFGAGTRLHTVGQELDRIGQALPNMPDIDQQTLAGALGTATHGTGAMLSCMSEYVVGLDLLNAAGELVETSLNKHSEVFRAAQVNLGALGFITNIRLQNRPAFRLERHMEWWRIEKILENAEELASRHRNFEFYYIPFTGMGFIDMQDVTNQELSSSVALDTEQNDGLYTLKQVRDWLSWSPRLRQLILGSYMRSLPKEHSIGQSWATTTHTRAVRFNEMEYHMPREAGLKAFREIHKIIETDFPEVFFPIEVRFVKGDEIWLSPFYQQDCISIAVHRYFAEDHEKLFQAVEVIFRKHNGRPHWGKFHNLKGQDLAKLYPNWEKFLTVRRELDPNGRFLNPYLRVLFGETPS